MDETGRLRERVKGKETELSDVQAMWIFDIQESQ